MHVAEIGYAYIPQRLFLMGKKCVESFLNKFLIK